MLLPLLPKAGGRAALAMSEKLYLWVFYLRPTGFLQSRQVMKYVGFLFKEKLLLSISSRKSNVI